MVLPEDISVLVGQAYGEEPVGPPGWQAAIDEQRERWLFDIDRRVAEATKFQIAEPSRTGAAIPGWVSGSVGETDDDAQGQGQVRDGVRSLEAILVQDDGSGSWQTPAWLPDGQGALPVPTEHLPANAIAEILLQCTLRLPVVLSSQNAEDDLRTFIPGAWKQSKLIYEMPVVVVDREGLGEIDGRVIRYTPEMGLEVLEVAKK